MRGSKLVFAVALTLAPALASAEDLRSSAALPVVQAPASVAMIGRASVRPGKKRQEVVGALGVLPLATSLAAIATIVAVVQAVQTSNQKPGAVSGG